MVQTLLMLCLPLMFPVMILLLLSVITSLNQFTIAYSITAGGPARTTELYNCIYIMLVLQGFSIIMALLHQPYSLP